jgi:topoisomerase-4 subunit B
MNPDTRRTLQIDFDAIEDDTRRIMTMLMGKGEASSRRAWLEENGNLAEGDI